MTFSHYKNTNTLKGMFGIMSCEAISLISPLFCGSISDKEISLKSGLIIMLEPNNVVMTDKGFLIGKELEKVGCHLKQPLFLRDDVVMADKGFLIGKELEKVECHLKQPLFLRDKIQFEIRENVKNC